MVPSTRGRDISDLCKRQNTTATRREYRNIDRCETQYDIKTYNSSEQIRKHHRSSVNRGLYLIKIKPVPRFDDLQSTIIMVHPNDKLESKYMP
jgi:hypothetical protein